MKQIKKTGIHEPVGRTNIRPLSRGKKMDGLKQAPRIWHGKLD